MSIDVNFYTYGKKINSTATPSTVNYAATCELRAGTDQLNPVILLDYPNPVAFNYAQIPAFSRYYFINEWTWQGGVWAGSLRVDPLASWKNTIRAYSQFVLRSASQYNENLTDTYFPIEVNPTETFTEMTPYSPPPWIGIGEEGETDNVYVAQIANSLGVFSYAFSSLSMSNFLRDIMNLAEWEQLVKTCIIDIYRVPFNCALLPIATPVTQITFPGDISISVSDCVTVTGTNATTEQVHLLTPTVKSQWIYVVTPENDEFLNYPPFITYHLIFPPFGEIEIPYEYVYDNKITIQTAVDITTGTAELSLMKAGTAEPKMYTQVTVPFRFIAGNDTNISSSLSVVSSTLGVLGGAASGNILGAIDSATRGIYAGITGFKPEVDVKGCPGMAILNSVPVIKKREYNVSFNGAEKVGRLLSAYVPLNNLTGYCICVDASLPLTCTETEHNDIINYMNGGFYLE